MKKTTTTLLMLLTVCFAFAQSLQLYERGTTTEAKSNYTFKINNTSVKSAYLHFDCKNISTTKDIPIRIKVTLFEYPNGCQNPDNNIAFTDNLTCNRLQSLPDSLGNYLSETGMDMDINKGTTINPALNTYFDVYTECIGTYKVRYCLYDRTNIADSVSVVITYDVGTSIEENKNETYKLSDAYPSPASENVFIDYNFASQPKTATLELYNAIGVKVNELNIEGTEGKIKMDVNKLADGIYFYSLIVDGNKISTKKMIIAD